MTCLTCAFWTLRLDKKPLPMSRHGFGLCAKVNVWTFYPPQHTCNKYKTAFQEVKEARIQWYEKSSNLANND